ncbi:tyrosine-type recombinase/integrase [Flavobacterium yafengii]|uniref:tyrosine-type recombinase/integrase n=1 Tax=Flavobacterium yafengii TaxID=3041253 RepID=UPI0024A86964|nr:tyrosine-type recombinase/integrase [Flavobacterium yafengii]MDI5887634.1 tyrosine-type recombinase/integrase [Flavobacterium yafengii]
MKKLELNTITFIEALERFSIRLQTQGASERQVSSKTNGVNEFLHYLEQNSIAKLSQINQKLVSRYFEYLRNRPLETKDGTMSTAYLLKHRESVLRFIEFVMNQQNEIGQGQSGIQIRIDKTEKLPKEILLENEIEVLFNACDSSLLGIRDKAILSLLYGCGLRRKEALQLEINEIDLNKGRIHIDKSKTKNARDIPMSAKVQQNIEEYLFNVRNLMLDTTSELTSFLITERGTEMSDSALAKMMERLSEKVNMGKSITCHLLRHSIATHLHRNMTIEDVAKFLGHTCLDSTMIYTHLKNEYYG